MNDSSTWDEIYTKTNYNPAWSKPGLDKNIDQIVQEILSTGSQKEISVLDVGCGNGRNSLVFDHIAKPVVHYTGIDFSGAAIEYCQKTYGKEKVFLKQNISEPIEPSQIQPSLKGFDLIIDCGCFHSILPEDRETYIENIRKLAKKDATFILGAWFKKETALDITTPRYFPYLYLDEWLFDQTDISKLFAPYFSLKSNTVDKTVYPDINDGFIYCVLTGNGSCKMDD